MVIEPYGIGTGYFALSGSVQATGTIYNIGMDVYPLASNGLVIDQLSDFHLDTLQAATAWSYQTTSTQTPFTIFHQYIDFLAGAAPTTAAFSTARRAPVSSSEPLIVQRETQRQSSNADRDARKAAFQTNSAKQAR
jgi:hypothetical protein